MKRVIIILGALCMCYLTSTAQVTRNNWLFGGTMGFSSSKYSNNLGSINYTIFRMAGTAGYFIRDKLAVGLKPNVAMEYTKNVIDAWSKAIAIGPFVRYYVLPEASKTNLFFEGDYAYGNNGYNTYQAMQNSNSYSIFMGPEFFFNSAVGLELSIGYTHTRSNDAASYKSNLFQVGIGFQFHLEKEE